VIRFVSIGLLVAHVATGQRIEQFELKPHANAATGTLVAQVSRREVTISNQALKAWKGWNPTVLLYTQPRPGAAGNPGGEALVVYDATLASSRVLTTEQSKVVDVTCVLLQNNEYSLVIAMRDSQSGAPSVALANTKSGVYRRQALASVGAIVNDTVELRHFTEEEVARAKGDLAIMTPTHVSSAKLVAGAPSPVGNADGVKR
jgi:hypothetical protein